MTYKLFNQAGKMHAASASLAEVMLYGISHRHLKFYFITNAQGAVVVNEMKGRKLPSGHKEEESEFCVRCNRVLENRYCDA